jgi:hypothetical protein
MTRRFLVECDDEDDLQETVDRLESIGVNVSTIDGLIIQGKFDDEDLSALVDLNLDLDIED